MTIGKDSAGRRLHMELDRNRCIVSVRNSDFPENEIALSPDELLLAAAWLKTAAAKMIVDPACRPDQPGGAQ